MLLPALLLSLAAFNDGTADAGLSAPGAKEGGLAVADLDGDGCLDLVVNTNQPGTGTRLFLQNRTARGTYTDVTSTWCPDCISTVTERSVVLGDVNGDGRPDLVRTSSPLIDVRFNDGAGSLSPYWSRTGTMEAFNLEGAGLLDFDADGRLDLVLQTYGFELWRNSPGPMPFTRESDAGLPTDFTDNGEYLAVTDFDVDGWPDVVARLQHLPQLWFNDEGHFSAAPSFTAVSNVADGTQNKGAVVTADFDGDGDFDLFWSQSDPAQNQVWEQIAPREFRATQVPAGAFASYGYINGAAAGDVDDDGRVDLVVSTLNAGTILLRNVGLEGGIAFQPQTLPGPAGRGVGVVLADDDGDGDLDVFVNQEPEVTVFRNSGSERRSSGIQLIRNNRDEIGASMHLEHCDGRRASAQYEVSGGMGRGSQASPIIHVSLVSFVTDEPVVLAVRHVGGTVTKVARMPAAQKGALLRVDFADLDDLSLCAPPQVDAGTADDAGMARFTTTPALVAVCDEPFTYQPQVTDLAPDATFTLSARDGTPTPGGMTCDPRTGRIEWTPGPQRQTFFLRLTAGDAEQRFDLTVDCPPRVQTVGCSCASGPVAFLVVVLLSWLWQRPRSRVRSPR